MKLHNYLHGKILGIRDLVLYEGTTLKELEEDFHRMADFYIEDQAARKGTQTVAV